MKEKVFTTFRVTFFNGKKFVYVRFCLEGVCTISDGYEYVLRGLDFEFYFSRGYFVKGIFIV